MSTEGQAPIGKAEQALADRNLSQRAAATPLPGPSKDAFARHADIVVDQYKVRPFYDGDFEILQSLNHPLCLMASGQGKYEDLKDLRGMNGWLLCYLLTHPIDEVWEKSDDLEAFKKAARNEFGKLTIGAIIEIQKAVMEQFSKYFSTIVGFEPDTEDETGVKKNPSV